MGDYLKFRLIEGAVGAAFGLATLLVWLAYWWANRDGR
jgi:hypothetical protein